MDSQDLKELEACLRRVGRTLQTSAVRGVRHKDTLDLVSDLDLWAEREVTEFLNHRFAGDTVLSEETSSSVTYAPRIWVLDPLDGTVNRTADVPFFGVSLALLEDGEPTLAYVYDPTRDELFSARRGFGARLNDARISVTNDGVFGVAMTSKLLRRLIRANPEALADFLSDRGSLRNFGSQALHLSYVAAGRLAGAASLETKLWDNAAGILIVTEAGGICSTLDGDATFPITTGDAALLGESTPCLAGAPAMHSALLTVFTAAGV